MKTAPCDFRQVTFLPGQKIAYARRGSDGRIYLQSATIQAVERRHRYLKSSDDEDVDSLLVRRPNGKQQRLTRFDAIAVLKEER